MRWRARADFAAIAYGINADDTRDFRPGHRAAHEHHVLAPLLEAGLYKSEIRFLSQRAGLATWNRPASACLSSRVPYGTAVTPELLDKIDRAEAVLRALDFRQFRVRAHGELARIEIAPDELARGFDACHLAENLRRRQERGLLVCHLGFGRLSAGLAQFSSEAQVNFPSAICAAMRAMRPCNAATHESPPRRELLVALPRISLIGRMAGSNCNSAPEMPAPKRQTPK